MFRVNDLGHVDNHFYGGDPTLTNPLHATKMPAAWFNAVQREIVEVIEKSGKTLHNSSEAIQDMNQLLGCINQSYATFSTGSSGAGITVKNCLNCTVTRQGNGVYDVAFTRNYANENYAVSIGLGTNGSMVVGLYDMQAVITDPTISGFTIIVAKKGGTFVQFDGMRVAIRVTGRIN